MNELRLRLIKALWNNYCGHISLMPNILSSGDIVLDHLAIIDLKSNASGINTMTEIFKALEFEVMGSGYLPSKQNNFIWMGHKPSFELKPLNALPQIVLADFENQHLSPSVKAIVERCSHFIKPFDLNQLHKLIAEIKQGDTGHIQNIINMIITYITIIDWPVITVEDYKIVYEQNQLLAWVLLFGKRINHFGLGIYTLDKYQNLGEFVDYLSRKNIPLNYSDAKFIQGNKDCGIEQCSTIGNETIVNLYNGFTTAKSSFIEFVWRHALVKSPNKLRDYFCGFVANNADYVIESIYVK